MCDLILPLSAALGTMLGTTTIAVIICAALNVKLQKNYVTTKEQLKAIQVEDSGIGAKELTSEFYEEIDVTPRASANTAIDMNDNAAYSTVVERGL